MTKLTLARARTAIKRAGALLVYPIKGRDDMPSLWTTFYPGEEMDWDWSEESDGRVAELWHLRTKLSTCGDVVYSKWFRNRATLFSTELFTALLSLVSIRDPGSAGLSDDASNILALLYEDSPLGSKALKSGGDLAGREYAARFERAMKELWLRFLVVGYGELDEGGYPSLAIGAARLLFEEQWDASLKITAAERSSTVAKFFPARSPFAAQLARVERQLTSPCIP